MQVVRVGLETIEAMKEQEVYLKRGVLFPPQSGRVDIMPGFYMAKIVDGFAYLVGSGGIGVTIEWVEILPEMVEFTCPVDKTLKIEVSRQLAKRTPHCTRLDKENRNCPFIKAGCTGCTFKNGGDFTIKNNF